jgi:hypothetical protein
VVQGLPPSVLGLNLKSSVGNERNTTPDLEEIIFSRGKEW